MAGHSKWANIKYRKGAQDAKRGKIFTKLIREITVAAKSSGDLNSNPRLRLAIDKALANNMTRDTIDRAIKRGVGGEDSANMEEMRYEGYGPNGIAIMVDCLSDNRNRTVSDVRHAFTKHGGQLGTDGSVSYLFKYLGQIIFEPGVQEEQIMDIALEAGAEDVIVQEDGSIEVLSSFENFSILTQAFGQHNIKPANAEMTMIPTMTVVLEDEEDVEKLTKIMDTLEDLDDVQNVYHNADLPDEA